MNLWNAKENLKIKQVLFKEIISLFCFRMHLEYVTYNLLFVKKVFSEIDFHYLNEKKK